MRKFCAVFLVLVWMLVIFSFSKEDGNSSSSLTENIIVNTVEIISDIEPKTPQMDEAIKTLSFPLRKCAHFFMYFILGLLCSNALYQLGIKHYTLIIAASICILYAISDEVHQLFIEGRSGQISDILLDSSASLLASYIFHKCYYLRNRDL